MKKWISAVAVLGLVGAIALALGAQDVQHPEPPMLGLHWARGFARPGGGGNANMTYHNGPIMANVSAASIFWGTSWATYTGDKETGVDKWYTGFNGSRYAATSDEYTDNTGHQVTTSVSYGGHYVDTTAASGGGSTSAILAEVCKVIPNPQTNGYYAVYTDLPRGNANYCAWHSWGSCGGTNVQFAFFWKLDGDAGCDPQSTVSGESQGLAALANVSGHELSEARTDPRGNAWYDRQGSENGDKCAWTFQTPYVTFSDGTNWKIQGEWSNNAYSTNTGYPNNSGQNGCLQGQ